MAIVLLTVAIIGSSRAVTTMVVSSNQHAESTIAMEAARRLIERLRAEPFEHVYRRYNDDRLDDPGGAGSSPGSEFDVPGLRALPGVASARVGRIAFPTVRTIDGKVALRENLEDERLGMPRDLNGDGVIDRNDHAHDHCVLPIHVRVEWRGVAGPSKFEVWTMLGGAR